MDLYSILRQQWYNWETSHSRDTSSAAFENYINTMTNIQLLEAISSALDTILLERDK